MQCRVGVAFTEQVVACDDAELGCGFGHRGDEGDERLGQVGGRPDLSREEMLLCDRHVLGEEFVEGEFEQSLAGRRMVVDRPGCEVGCAVDSAVGEPANSSIAQYLQGSLGNLPAPLLGVAPRRALLCHVTECSQPPDSHQDTAYSQHVLRDRKVGRRSFFSLAAAAGAGLAAPRAAAAPTDDRSNLRYHGYTAEDAAQPYARFMATRTDPPLESVAAKYIRPPTPPARIPEFSLLTSDLAADGYSAVETGYGQSTTGVVWVAVHTPMPGATAAMWDWWFGWYSVESARYKLWHPDAHMYASQAVDRSAEPISDRDKYIGNISYVDEYVGPKLQQLAIAFKDPLAHGFAVPVGQTVILARVGSAVAPVDLGWLAHQVRPIDGGCEMRSRFYLNIYDLHIPDPAQAGRAIQRGAVADPADLRVGTDLARELLLHCGQEMHHLSRFLPQLHQEFGT
ncbi:hypothetical protein AB0M45_23185 [Nocardia sp. NPDC051787]|uniref:DAPG hydrolase family protein n=1 Tax=Nocardia sp. NPDC051787 TaxID=3155415 RepID=UPI0034208D0F